MKTLVLYFVMGAYAANLAHSAVPHCHPSTEVHHAADHHHHELPENEPGPLGFWHCLFSMVVHHPSADDVINSTNGFEKDGKLTASDAVLDWPRLDILRNPENKTWSHPPDVILFHPRGKSNFPLRAPPIC